MMIKDLLAQISRLPNPIPRRPLGRFAGFLRRFSGKKTNIVVMVSLSILVSCALFADLLASDKPIVCVLDGELYILPAVFAPPELQQLNNQMIATMLERDGGFAILPPIPYGPNQTKINDNIDWLQPPSRAHLLGTDDSGRDVLSRIIHGARTAAVVGIGSVMLYILVAVLLGAVAGYFGGYADRIALRIIETFSSFPTFFLILTIQGLLGATSVMQLVLVIGLTRWTDVARLTRAEVLRLVHEDYVTAARALGLGHITVLLKHVLPGALGPVWIAAYFGVAGSILIESTLSFLGFGVPGTTPSWGQLLTDAFHNEGCYWLALFPGFVLFATVMSINVFGEGMQAALDPDTRRSEG